MNYLRQKSIKILRGSFSLNLIGKFKTKNYASISRFKIEGKLLKLQTLPYFRALIIA